MKGLLSLMFILVTLAIAEMIHSDVSRVRQLGHENLQMKKRLNQMTVHLKNLQMDWETHKEALKKTERDLKEICQNTKEAYENTTEAYQNTKEGNQNTKSDLATLKTALEGRLNTLEEKMERLEDAHPDLKCPRGFVKNGVSCYWFSTERGNFSNAKSVCDLLDSHLAIINSKSEDDFLRGYAREQGGARFYFLDGTDIAQEGNWTWGNGTPMTYVNWGSNQPDDTNNEDCLGLWKPVDYKWNDDRCGRNSNFICEK